MVAHAAGEPAALAASLGYQRADGITRECVQAIQDLLEFIKRESGGGEEYISFRNGIIIAEEAKCSAHSTEDGVGIASSATVKELATTNARNASEPHSLTKCGAAICTC